MRPRGLRIGVGRGVEKQVHHRRPRIDGRARRCLATETDDPLAPLVLETPMWKLRERGGRQLGPVRCLPARARSLFPQVDSFGHPPFGARWAFPARSPLDAHVDRGDLGAATRARCPARRTFERGAVRAPLRASRIGIGLALPATLLFCVRSGPYARPIRVDNGKWR